MKKLNFKQISMIDHNLYINKKPELSFWLFLIFNNFYYKTKETETLEIISISPMANVSFSGICSYATSTDFIEA